MFCRSLLLLSCALLCTFVVFASHNEIICPGGTTKCPDSTTCCDMGGGEWGCCPAIHAVCCPDKLHCCPGKFLSIQILLFICDCIKEGFRCDEGRCVHTSGHFTFTAFKKFPATPIRRKVAIELMSGDEEQEEEYGLEDSDENEQSDEQLDLPKELRPIACGQSRTCPAKTTCCIVQRGRGRVQHMCCPLSNGVCCENSCCPAGYHCIAGGKCEKHARKHYEQLFKY